MEAALARWESAHQKHRADTNTSAMHGYLRDELAKASPEEVQAEIAQLWRSVRSAQLLLAGDVSFGA